MSYAHYKSKESAKKPELVDNTLSVKRQSEPTDFMLDLSRQRRMYTKYVTAKIDAAMKGENTARVLRSISPLEQHKVQAMIRLGQRKQDLY